jgi:signal transduction histidine kinase
LTRVLVNLVENAVKFTDAGTVSVAPQQVPDGTIRIAVTDTGCGIAPDDLPRLFDEFFRVRERRDHHPSGRGLGLATCKRLVEAMGGRLEVQSTLGTGSTFTIVLPASFRRAAREPAATPDDAPVTR